MAKLRVTLNLPTTEEGRAAFEQAMIQFNSKVLAYSLNKLTDIPYDAKAQYVQSLNGIVPWAKAGG